MWNIVRIEADDRLPLVVIGTGLLFAGLFAGQLLAITIDWYDFTLEFMVGVVTALPFVIGLVAIGIRLDANIPTPYYPHVIKWFVGGMISFLIINLVMMLAIPPRGLQQVIGWVVWAASLGAGAGALIGYYHAQAVHEAVQAHQSAIRAEELEHRRKLLSYLNSLLRHEVLNTANVIGGYAELLRNHRGDSDEMSPIEIILRQSTDLASITRDVRVLIQANEGFDEREPVDLVNLIRDELRKVEDRYPNAEILVDFDGGLTVMADTLLGRLFSNLFNNAIEHNESDRPQLSVTTNRLDDEVRVLIEDDGPGIPEEKRDGLFELDSGAGTDHGLGLNIVGTLAERYGGSVALVESTDEGSRFDVALPVVSSETGQRDGQMVSQ